MRIGKYIHQKARSIEIPGSVLLAYEARTHIDGPTSQPIPNEV